MGILITLICLIIAGGIALVSLGCPPVFYLGISLIGIGILALLLIGVWRLWFSNRSWKFTCSELPKNCWKQYFKKGENIIWRSQNSQVEGMSYRLDLGRERRFDFIRFYHGISNETPQKWQMWFYRKDNSYALRGRRPYIQTGDTETRQDTVAIIVELKQPISARYIEAKILEPMVINDKICHWRVEAIFLRLVLKQLKLLNRYTIGKCWLDKL